MIPATVEASIERQVNDFIEAELAKLPGVLGHLIPGIAGLLVQAALGSDMVQAEAKKLAEKGADFVIAESVKGLNDVQAAVLAFLKQHPALEALYAALHPTLTNGQVLHLLADEAKAMESFILQGRRAEFRAVLGLKRDRRLAPSRVNVLPRDVLFWWCRLRGLQAPAAEFS